MKPLLITSAARPLLSPITGRRESDLEVRQVPAFPAASTLDQSRPTVIALDRVLLTTVRDDRQRIE